ncbi:MAG: phosphoglycolate phosphatase [Pseudomonadota bacterium]
MRAVIFDLDGTLVHSAPDIHAAANRMLADVGRPALPLEDVTRFIGNGTAKLVERCLVATGGVGDAQAVALATYRRHFDPVHATLTRPYPGAVQCLEALSAAGLPLGLCTNRPEGSARGLLAKLALDRHFAVVVGGDTTQALKPDPTPLNACLQGLGADGRDAVFVGDSETDAETAHRAAIPFALFTGGYRKQPVAAVAAIAGDAVTFDDHDSLASHLISR